MKTLACARLLLAHDRTSLLRLLGIVCGVAVGTALFLTLWGFAQGLTTRTERATWPDYATDGTAGMPAGELTGELSSDQIVISGNSAVLYSSLADHFLDKRIGVVSIAATADSTVAVPGAHPLPGPGEYLASPAAAALIAEYPVEALGERYGQPAGILGDEALGSPGSLLILRGMTLEEIREQPDATVVSSLAGKAFSTSTFRIAAIVGSIAILLPVLLLISIITRLGAAQRSETFATLRLIGATPAQIARLAVLETGVTSLVGAVLGAVLAWAASPLFAQIQIDNERFFASDIQPSLPFALGVALLITLATTFVAWVRALRSQNTDLGASRELMEKRPGLWRLVPVLLGMLALVGGGWLSSNPVMNLGVSELLFGALFVAGFAAILIGLVLAGPLLTWWASRFAARFSRGAAGVIAFARIRQHPQATFRAVGGLVVAVFVASFFFAAITIAHVEEEGDGRDSQQGGAESSSDTAGASERSAVGASPDLLHASLSGGYTVADMDAVQEQLKAADGVTGVAPVYYHERPTATEEGSNTEGEASGGAEAGPSEGIAVLRARDAAVLGIPEAEVPDAPWIELPPRYLPSASVPEDADPEASIQAAQFADSSELRPSYLFVGYDGDPLMRERIRTVLLTSSLRLAMVPLTIAEMRDDGATDSFVQEYAYLANLGVLIATAVSGISMAVSTVSSILDRRRTLALMRLAGMPHTTLRRMIAAETLLPLLVVFLLSAGLGFVVAQLLLSGLTAGRRSVIFSLLDPTYFVVLALSLLLATAAILATFPTARRSTALSVTRFE
ncbi:MAG: FtsX-like permease family protein [Coriobacteriales bacterium]|jgi:ABC-type antimicrobial peptide transport system permease subunit|nr:FtsX-like permease family protein [Coriobacteriales bacterium]